MKVKNLEDLFVREFSSIYNAEKQLVKALPKMANAAFTPTLSDAFRDHLEETRNQVLRLERIMDICNIRHKKKKCDAMEAMIDEGNDIIHHTEESLLRDTALASAARKIEHYEICCYLDVLKLCKQLGYREAIPLLHQTLNEEESADNKLSELADWQLKEQLWQMTEPDQEDRRQQSSAW